MNEEISQIMSELYALCRRSISDGEFGYSHNQELEKHCELLGNIPQYDIWVPLLYQLAEEFDEEVDLTLGSPGAIVFLLEELRPMQDKYLVQSMERKPSTISLMVAITNRELSKDPNDETFWRQKIKDVATHPEATPTALEMAKDHLDYHQLQ